MTDLATKDLLGAAVVRPGDTLIIGVGRDISREHFEEFYDQIRNMVDERLPGVKFVVLAVDQFAVYRPGGDTDD